VISQKPAPGDIVQPGSAVYLVFASPPLVTVPDLKNSTRDGAATLLTGWKLKLGRVRGTGRVISQDPRPGSRVAPGSAVDIMLWLAPRVVRQNPPPSSSAPPTTPVPPTVLVPDLRGLTSADATQRLTRYRLLVGTRTGAGTVTEQDPAAGRRVRVGTAVNLFLSRPAVELVVIPNLRGLDLGAARATAQAAGLRLDAGDATTGTVASQSLAAGSQVARGSVVTVTVAVPSIVATTAGRHADTNWNPASWNIVALALIALAALLICTTGLLARTKRARRGSRAKAKPWSPDGIEVSYRLAESRLQTTPTGSAPRRMRVDLHGPIAAIEIKEVPR